jgi:hypothetical protein
MGGIFEMIEEFEESIESNEELLQKNSRVRELCIDIIAKTTDVEITANAREILKIFENNFK